MRIHLATDHAGFDLKETVKTYLQDHGYDILDHGAHEFNKLDDYPDYIFPAAYAVSEEPESFGIIFGGSGQGEAMTANRVKGVRAAVYYNGPEEIVKLSRSHNNANILSIGYRFLDEKKAIHIIELWLNGAFEGGRHDSRIRKLDR